MLEGGIFCTNVIQLKHAIAHVRKRGQACLAVEHDQVHHVELQFLQLGDTCFECVGERLRHHGFAARPQLHGNDVGVVTLFGETQFHFGEILGV